MAGQKPDYRLMFPEDNGRGKKTWFKIGGGWKSEEKGTVGIEINVGLPIIFQSGAARCGKQVCNRAQDAAVEDVEGGQMRIDYKNDVYEASEFRFTDNRNDLVFTVHQTSATTLTYLDSVPCDCWTASSIYPQQTRLIEVSVLTRRGPLQRFASEARPGALSGHQVCRKCAVRCDPVCAKTLLFNTRSECFRTGSFWR